MNHVPSFQLMQVLEPACPPACPPARLPACLPACTPTRLSVATPARPAICGTRYWLATGTPTSSSVTALFQLDLLKLVVWQY